MRILYITTIGRTMTFFVPFIKELMATGNTVDIATNENNGDTAVPQAYRDLGCSIYHIDTSRSPVSIGNIKAIKQIRTLIARGKYDIVHCHTPLAAAATRVACRSYRNRDLNVIYTAHGFHFYTGAPLKNWLIYYPIEWICSWWTDVLITINQEDFKRASEHLHAKKTEYVPGVGIDTNKFSPRKSGRERIRKELELPDEWIMVLSVGELNENKNHSSVIRAIAGMKNITYVIVGKGEERDHLEILSRDIGVDVRLIGFRDDVSDFYDAADIYVLPSIREGLNVSLMEAMASSLPVACGNIRGNVDLITRPECLFTPTNINEIRSALDYIIEHREELGSENIEKIRRFDLNTVNVLTTELYRGESVRKQNIDSQNNPQDAVSRINTGHSMALEKNQKTEFSDRLGGYEHLKLLLQRQQKRAEIGVPIDCKLLISVGELSVRKNHKVVVEALQDLPDNYYYIIVGRGNLQEELMNIDATGRLKLLGYRTDIRELLGCSDLFVFPSLQEGLPVALMEAMAAGIPCIASKIRGNTDLIPCKEKNDAADWRNEILNYENIEYNIDVISADNVNRQMKQIYQSLLK